MKRQRLTRLLDAGILVVVVVAARMALAQEPRAAEPPRPTVAPRVAPPTAPRPAPAVPGTATAPARPSDGADSPPGVTPPMSPPTPHADGRIALQLKDGSRLVGKLVGLETLKLKASFGEIDVPVDSIQGLKLHESDRPTENAAVSATVLFKNGDVLTAEPLIASLKLETSWGDTAIAGKHLESLVTTSEKVAWVFDGKWRIVPEGAAGGSWAPPPTGRYLTPYGPSATFAPGTPVPTDPVGRPVPPSYGPPVSVPMGVPAPVAPPMPLGTREG